MHKQAQSPNLNLQRWVYLLKLIVTVQLGFFGSSPDTVKQLQSEENGLGCVQFYGVTFAPYCLLTDSSRWCKHKFGEESIFARSKAHDVKAQAL